MSTHVEGPLFRIGIDLGGTKIEGLVARARWFHPGAAARVHASPRLRRPPSRPSRALVSGLEQQAGRRARTVGIGMPGTISPATGLVKNANSAWLNGQPLAEDLEARLRRPVRLANDANCFALSEASDGAAANAAASSASSSGRVREAAWW